MYDPAREAIPPIHCLSVADRWDLLDLDSARCDSRHEAAADALAIAVDWLRQVGSDLRAGKVGRIVLTHPTVDTPPLSFDDIDPSTAYVLITGGRRGLNDALEGDSPALYVGVVAQATSTQWRGLAGVFTPLCSCPGEARGRAPALRILRALDIVPRAERELPAGLSPSDQWPTWLDERLVTAGKFFAEEAQWRFVKPEEVNDSNPILVTTGPRLSDEPNVMYLASASDLSILTPHLPATLTCRRGPANELTELCSIADAPFISPLRLRVSRRNRSAAAGWCTFSIIGKHAVITRSCLLWLAAHPSVPYVDVLYASRLKGGLAIDGTTIISLLTTGAAAQESRSSDELQPRRQS